MDIDAIIASASAHAESTTGLVLALGAVDASGVEHAQVFGADGDVVLPSCSAFKPLVAAAVRSAATDGILDLDVPVPQLPGGHAAPPDWSGSLEEVLRHVSGLAGDLYEVPVGASDDHEATATLLSRFLPFVPRTDPGRFWYSNLGYALAGHVLAEAEDEELLTVVRRRVLDPAGAEVWSRRDTEPVHAEHEPPPNDSLRAAGCGTLLRPVDLARAGAFMAGAAGQRQGMLRTEPVTTIPAAGQHQVGGFFLDQRYGRPLLVHGGGHGAYGASWIVDPVNGWSCAVLFNDPAGYALDLAAVALGTSRGSDPRRRRTTASPGWYLNEYAGIVEIRSDSIRVNGRALRGVCVADGDGIALNETPMVIGSRPFRPVADPSGATVDPELGGSFDGAVDRLNITIDDLVRVESAARGTVDAVALTPRSLACDLGVIELDGDSIRLGAAYRFERY